jgi:hypothetical protein
MTVRAKMLAKPRMLTRWLLALYHISRVCRVATCDCVSWKMKYDVCTQLPKLSRPPPPHSGPGTWPTLLKKSRSTTAYVSVISWSVFPTALLCTMCMKGMHIGLVMYVCPSAWFNSRTALRIWMKFGMDVMPLECTVKSYPPAGWVRAPLVGRIPQPRRRWVPRAVQCGAPWGWPNCSDPPLGANPYVGRAR